MSSVVVAEPPPLVDAGAAPSVPSPVSAADPLRGLRVAIPRSNSTRPVAPLPPPGRARPRGDRHGHHCARSPVNRRPRVRRAVPEAIERVDWHAPVLPWDDPHAQKLFAVIRDSPLGARLAAATEIHCERPFLVRVDGAIIEGVADVWARSQRYGAVPRLEDRDVAWSGRPGYALQQAIYAWRGCGRGLRRSRRRGAMWCTRARWWWGGTARTMRRGWSGGCEEFWWAGRGPGTGRGEARAGVQPVSGNEGGVSRRT